MYNSSVYETADVISTYVYRKGIESSNYSFASAIGLFNSVINFAFVFVRKPAVSHNDADEPVVRGES